jgi:hypothetical protein
MDFSVALGTFDVVFEALLACGNDKLKAICGQFITVTDEEV